ncbi:hypothetical protein J4210_03470 [Candidatus Woesearchaeota archaeon]|nr:hypothetical protein [Candidatus Woesearchaeota archaeon]
MHNTVQQLKILLAEDSSLQENCVWCQEAMLPIGTRTKYNAVVIFRIGDSIDNGWFATLSPQTGGDPQRDFTVQLMTFGHFSHFAQLAGNPKLAKNYGLAFGKLNAAMTMIMAEEQPEFKAVSPTRETGAAVAAYGKCTTWQEKKEHLHLKLFPFRGDLGQPSIVDSTFGKKQIHYDHLTKEEFVKMKPIRKVLLPEKRLVYLAGKIVSLLCQETGKE